MTLYLHGGGTEQSIYFIRFSPISKKHSSYKITAPI